MNDQTAASNGLDNAQWDSSLEVRFPSVDTDYEWLGYEAVHPLTWVPNNAATLAASAAV